MLANVTADELVAEYIKIKDYCAAESKKFMEFLQPYKARQDEIEVKLLEMLNALGGDGRQSLKTNSGTAYKSTIVTPKIVERDAYLDAIMENWDTWGSGMLQLMAPKKEAVDDFVKENGGALPPGVQASAYVRVNIRRA